MNDDDIESVLDEVKLVLERKSEEHKALRLRVKDLTRENAWLWAALRDTYADLQQMVPGMSKPYVEDQLTARSELSRRDCVNGPMERPE